jgi:hypothetical protein
VDANLSGCIDEIDKAIFAYRVILNELGQLCNGNADASDGFAACNPIIDEECKYSGAVVSV